MRICLLTSSYPRYEGDIAGNFIRGLCNELAARGMLIEVVAPGDTQIHSPLPDAGIRVHRFRYAAPRRLQALAYGDGLEENLRRRPLRMLLFPSFLSSFLHTAWRVARGCDLVWSHWLFPAGLIGGLASRITEKPHVLTLHSSPPRAAKPLARFIIGDNCRVVAVSRGLAAQAHGALNIPDERIRHIPMGARTIFLEKNMQELRSRYQLDDRFTILYMGRLVPIKGVETLVQAMKDIPGSVLVIAGEGGQLQRLREMARRLNAPVRFEGFVHGVKKLDLLSLCDIFASPSLVMNGGRQEGMPVSVIEALAAGLPVVASSTGGLPELITDGHNGFLVPPGDAPALSCAIRALRNDQALRERMSRNARASAAPYALHRVASQYAALFNSAVHA